MNRTSFQKAVFWAIPADFALLYVGAVSTGGNPAIVLVGLIGLGITVSGALYSF